MIPNIWNSSQIGKVSFIEYLDVMYFPGRHDHENKVLGTGSKKIPKEVPYSPSPGAENITVTMILFIDKIILDAVYI